MPSELFDLVAMEESQSQTSPEGALASHLGRPGTSMYTHFGDEPMIENLYNMNRLGEKIPGGPDLTDADIKQAREAAGVAKI